jgi:hypothetical protein
MPHDLRLAFRMLSRNPASRVDPVEALPYE